MYFEHTEMGGLEVSFSCTRRAGLRKREDRTHLGELRLYDERRQGGNEEQDRTRSTRDAPAAHRRASHAVDF